MRKLLLLFLCTIVPAVVSAQRLDVTGRVLVKDTGKPIGQAVVELPQSGLWAVADADGNFTVKGVPAGETRFVVSCLGFVTTEAEVDVRTGMGPVNFYVRRHLQADILTPATAAKRTAVSCRVRIRNGAFLPVMRYGCQVSIRNDLTEEDQTVTLTGSIGAKGESSQTILLQSSFCGRVYVQISRFTLLDYLGLLPMKALVKADARLTILPDLYPMEADMTARPAYADDGTSNRRGEDRSEVYQLREYRPGDDIRQIHWKLSSKLDELILKEASQPESRSLLVFWDKRTGGNPQQMDALAEVVSSAGMALLQSGVPYTLCWTDRDDLQVQDISEENQLLQAIPALVKTRGSAECRLPKTDGYSRILCFGTAPEEQLLTDGRVHFILCTEEQYPGATTFAPQNYSEAMQRLEV